ncbi:MAG: hypothetical protein ACI9V1_003362 [Spirosomataceae bacterium]|jgi:hypothetical protein
MTYIDKKIVDAYADLLSGMSKDSKAQLIERLSESNTKNESLVDKEFYSSFGAFVDEASAEEMIKTIKASRKFRSKDLGIT